MFCRGDCEVLRILVEFVFNVDGEKGMSATQSQTLEMVKNECNCRRRLQRTVCDGPNRRSGGGEEQGETVEVVVEEGKENEAGKQEVMVVFLSLGVEYRIPPDRLDALAVSA